MIELKQLEGRRRGRGGKVETIKQPTDEVWRDGKRVAFCGRFSGAPVCFVKPLNPAERDDIRRAIAKLREEGGEFGPPDEKTHAPPEEVPIEVEEDEVESDIWTPEGYEDE